MGGPAVASGAYMHDVILKRFDAPDEVRVFDKGRFELVRVGKMTIGRATYEPGWRWSVHAGAATGKTMCEVEHVGMVVSGCATAAMRDGRVIEMRVGDVFYIPPGHDSWVVGNEPYVSLRFVAGAKSEKQKLAALEKYRLEQRKRDVPLVEDFPLHAAEESADFRDLKVTLELRMVRASQHWLGNKVTLAELIYKTVEKYGPQI
jgi:quercetin dioxygenase-like cupin family protein